MPAEVKILVEGFTTIDSIVEMEEEITQPTITLIRDGDLIMVVDPGVLESQQILIDALSKESLTVHDVDIVCITHSHIDHYRNVGMFPKAKTLDYFGMWDGNKCEDWSKDLTENVQILKTPGHDYTSLSIIVNTAEGAVAICGDVFWKENFPQTPQDDAYASDMHKLTESRTRILEIADWIIPGHGPMYKNNRMSNSVNDAFVPISNIPIIVKCRKCGREMKPKDRCQCRQFYCYKCCECSLDCNNCSCSHRRF